MIRFIGLGLSLDMLSIGGLYRLLKCGKVYIDAYTSVWYPSVETLAKVLTSAGIQVVMAYRRDLEGAGISRVVEEAMNSDVCIAIVGDPMIATTHSAILVEALNRNIPVEITPSTSILNAVFSFTCLQVYRFGKIVTIVKPKNGVVYEYPLQIIKMNRELNLHTLALLEIDVENRYYMTPREALEILTTIQRNIGEEVLSDEDYIVILKAIGSQSSSITVEKVREILSKDYEESLYTLVIPARKLHPVEEECLQNVSKIGLTQCIDFDILTRITGTLLNMQGKDV